MSNTTLKPTPSTAKRLYALSGNRCAFPGCAVPIINPDTGANRGEIAHIKGEQPGAARYDPVQSDDQRRAFENLVLMCATHHKEIDHLTSRDRYSVEFLMELKANHEAGGLPDDLAAAVTDGTSYTANLSVVQFFQQAHQITNNFNLVPLAPNEELGLPDPHVEQGTVEWFRLQRILGMFRLAGIGNIGACETAFEIEPKLTVRYLKQLADANLVQLDSGGRRWCATGHGIGRFRLNKWVWFAAQFHEPAKQVLASKFGMMDFLNFGGWSEWFKKVPLGGPERNCGRLILSAEFWDSE